MNNDDWGKRFSRAILPYATKIFVLTALVYAGCRLDRIRLRSGDHILPELFFIFFLPIAGILLALIIKMIKHRSERRDDHDKD